jgi:hypothetical protein
VACPKGSLPPAPPLPFLLGPRTTHQALESTTYPPFTLGKVLLDLEADRWIDVPMEGCVPVDPVDAGGDPVYWVAVDIQPGDGQGSVHTGPGQN